jgi:hypothetical protein
MAINPFASKRSGMVVKIVSKQVNETFLNNKLSSTWKNNNEKPQHDNEKKNLLYV